MLNQNLNYRPISELEMLMRQSLEGIEDFTSNFGFNHAAIPFELLNTHAIEALPTRTVDHPFTARILHFPKTP